jgi:hypothetical protein
MCACLAERRNQQLRTSSSDAGYGTNTVDYESDTAIVTVIDENSSQANEESSQCLVTVSVEVEVGNPGLKGIPHTTILSNSVAIDLDT